MPSCLHDQFGGWDVLTEAKRAVLPSETAARENPRAVDIVLPEALTAARKVDGTVQQRAPFFSARHNSPGRGQPSRFARVSSSGRMSRTDDVGCKNMGEKRQPRGWPGATGKEFHMKYWLTAALLCIVTMASGLSV